MFRLISHLKHALTKEEFKEAKVLSSSNDYPAITENPKVNWAVDCLIDLTYEPYDPELYEKEVILFKS